MVLVHINERKRNHRYNDNIPTTVTAAASTIVAGRIARIALNENASRLEQNAAASPFPCVKKDSPLALTKLQRVDSRDGGGGISIILL